MAHYCTCPKCGKKFDRDKIQAVRIGARRYGHQTCYPDNTQLVPLSAGVNPEEEQLLEYCKELLGKEASPKKIRKQIQDYVKEGYSYSGIQKTLDWFYNIQKNEINEKCRGGIGIVPYCYQDALHYHYNLYLSNQVNADKEIEDYKPKERVVQIDVPESAPRIRKKMFNLGETEDE